MTGKYIDKLVKQIIESERLKQSAANARLMNEEPDTWMAEEDAEGSEAKTWQIEEVATAGVEGVEAGKSDTEEGTEGDVEMPWEEIKEENIPKLIFGPLLKIVE